MAVQAHHHHHHHHPSIVGLSSSDPCNRAANAADEELCLLHQSNVFGTRYGAALLPAVNNGLVLSEPQSDLTCGASRPRKRLAPEHPPPPPAVALPKSSDLVDERICYHLAAGEVPLMSASSYQQRNQLPQSSGTSTSGRRELVSHLLRHNAEIDAILRLESDRMQSGLKDLWKRQCVELLGGMEQRAAKRLREKEEELESARRRIWELEEKLRQAMVDVQMWFGLAKNNEAVVASLQASLEDVLIRNAASAPQDEEGYGDNEQDAQSCCLPEDPAAAAEVGRGRKGACRACGDAAPCVLLLPCRHLCLCGPCASRTEACPVCRSEKKTFLEVIIVS